MLRFVYDLSLLGQFVVVNLLLRRMILISVYLLTLLSLHSFAYRERSVPTQKKLVFFIGDTNYTLFPRELYWEKAAAVCRSHGGRLASLDTSYKASEMVTTIVDRRHEMQEVWIGGKRRTGKDGYVWEWDGTNTTIEETPNAQRFPPWLHEPTRKGKECLALNHKKHSVAIFIDENCLARRPYVCEGASVKPSRPPVTPVRFLAGKKQYYFFKYLADWREADIICTNQNLRLAILDEMRSVRSVYKYMFSARFEYDRVWLGGRHVEGHWLWMDTAERLPGPEEARRDRKSEYPPWKRSRFREGKECTQLEFNSIPLFIDASCDELRYFICEEPNEEQFPGETKTSYTYEDHTYAIYFNPTTWEEANEECEDATHSYLVRLDNNEEVQFLMAIMGNSTPEIKHVWLGGRMQKTGKWSWVSNKQPIPPRSKGSSFPPWADDDKSERMSCLNLDRWEYDIPALYGEYCDVEQRYICEREGAGPKQLDFRYKNKRIVIHNSKLTWKEAWSVCTSHKGALLSVEDEEELKFIHKNSGDYFRFWISIRNINGTWTNMKKKQPLKKVDGSPKWKAHYPKKKGNCAVVDQKGQEPVLANTDCFKDRYFACQMDIKDADTGRKFN